MKYRTERDSFGELKVPEDALWGAQTQRSLENFAIGDRRIPYDMIRALITVKKACALTNKRLGVLDTEKADGIIAACDKLLSGSYEDQFPLIVWQTGSGTQTNMNVNEVIAHMAGCHPNDHVNKSQSTNDVFPTAMHLCAVEKLNDELIPTLIHFVDVLHELEDKYMDLIKVGRTHLQDATPLTLGQEISAWREMITQNIDMIKDSLKYLSLLAIGGTAVGTGLNAHPQFAEGVVDELSFMSGFEFKESPNKFYSLSSKDAFVFAHGAVQSLACNLMKIANDVRWLASGPRCGIGELEIPANEAGSSIMPGKVNPTQSEALTMIVSKVMGNHTAISMSASQGNFQLNVFMPQIIADFIESVELISKGTASFVKMCISGLKPNTEKISEYLEQSLMLVTALTPHIGYDKAAEIAKTALKEKATLKETAVKLGYLSAEEYDKYMVIKEMTHPNL